MSKDKEQNCQMENQVENNIEKATGKKEHKKSRGKNQINITKRIVFTAVFAALSYGLSYLEFPIFPAAPFLKLDFSAVFIMLSAFMFGPIAGVTACGAKELLCFLTKSSTGGVGELANFIVISSFILLPSIVYCFKKGFLTVIVTLIIACFIQVGVALIVNRFINFPLFMGDMAASVFSELWVFVLLFNLIKSVAISAVTILLYKRLSKIIKAI